jgi:hypothetical protein
LFLGNVGVSNDTNTIRIGTQGTQTAAYVAGIVGSKMTGDAVVVSNTGKLGIMMSSARYKRDIRDMGEKSAGLMRLRPVTFRYKEDPAGTLQYGLVAEEVEEHYPELVTHAADGQVQSVRYSMLTGMLLNELQKQAEKISKLTSMVGADKVQHASLEKRLAALEQTIAAQTRASKLAAAFDR